MLVALIQLGPLLRRGVRRQGQGEGVAQRQMAGGVFVQQRIVIYGAGLGQRGIYGDQGYLCLLYTSRCV